MLHSLSLAAAEHSRTQGDLTTGLSLRTLTSFTHTCGASRTAGLLDDVDGEETTEASERASERSETPSVLVSFCQSLGLCIGYVIPDWGHLSLANVGRSWAAGAVALWHCYLFAATASLIVVNFAAAMLRSYIQWFCTTSVHVSSFYTLDFQYHTALGFFGAFFRCYILLSVAGDVLRFTYLLCKDTWRPDSFEAYRRLVVGDAWQEIEAGEMYCNNWSRCLSQRQKITDVQRFFPHPEALQEWSEQWCCVGVHAQKRQRYPFLMVLGTSALIFSFFRFAGVMMGCLCLSFCAFMRIIFIFGEGSIGWLWAFGETICEMILLNFVVAFLVLGTSALIFSFFRFAGVMMGCLCLSFCAFMRIIFIFGEGSIGWLWAFGETICEMILLTFVVASTADDAFRDTAVVMILCAMRQFGFQRKMSAGERLRMGSVNIMGMLHLLFVLMVCFALQTYGMDSGWSAFGPRLNETKYYSFQPDPAHPIEPEHAPHLPIMPLRNIFPMCNFRFRRGSSIDFRHGLSLVDFGLMASLTYEPHQRVPEACEYYFSSHWHLEPPLFKGPQKFLMFTSKDNQTTVIAVRGTLDFLDVLQDVSLWIVPALLQLFSSVGLDTSYGAWGMATAELSHLVPLSYINREPTVESVLWATRRMIETYPQREFYITGHSLGGGVAKLVKLAIPKGMRLQVVTFSAPGVHHAAHVLMPKLDPEHMQDLHAKMKEEAVSVVAVRPSNDLISLVDQGRGQTFLTSCWGNAYQCHSIHRTLWDIFSVCGSMRSTVLKVPCGWSPMAPC
eukprot:Skav205877  [mRNA]  locus=scaffold766:264654:269541:+ [translate_table: standard]